MTHNAYNGNASLERALPHTVGARRVRIGDGAGIKAGAIITMGVTIGRNAVVAAGAVVNRDVPEGCLVGGVPVQLLRQLELLDHSRATAGI